MAEPGLSEIITTTQRRRQKMLRDNITNNNAILKSMKKYGGLKTIDGGYTILEEVLYAENDNYFRYAGGQIFPTAYNTTMTSFEYDWKQFGISIVINGREERMNSGVERAINLMMGRIEAAEFTLENNYNSDLLSNGTADGGKQIGGLALGISKTPTVGSLGGIDRSTTAGAFARNFKFDTINDTTGGAPGGAITSSSNIKTYYNYCINSTTRGTDRVKLLLAGQTHYQALQGAMQAIQIVTDTKTAEAGYQNLIYEGIPVVMGGGVDFGGQSLVQTDLTYGINTRYTKVQVHKDADMEPLPETQSLNQDAKVKLMVWMGNMTFSAPRLNFVMFDS